MNKPKFDNVGVIGFPNSAFWADFYGKFRDNLVNSLNGGYCRADREDAVEEAFHKLMHKKGREAYGEKFPKTEEEWFNSLWWQARAYLSHLKDRGEVHAKYVETMAKVLADVFARGHQGESIDEDIIARALVSALEILREEQDVPRRALDIFVRLQMNGESARSVAERYGIEENNVYQIKFRTGRILRKYGPKCFEKALRKEGHR